MPWKRIELTKEEISEARADRKKARFLVDESVDSHVAELIRRLGHSAVHVADVGLSGHPDENVLAYAQRGNRVLLTHDPDFLDDRRFPPNRNPGIVILPGADGGKRDLLIAVNDVVTIVGQYRALWRSTKIVITRDQTWTVHTFERDIGQFVSNKYRIRGGVFEMRVDGK